MPGDAPIYLDNNATTPLCPEAREAMLPLLGAEFGNPSSVHAVGARARAAVARAREAVAALVAANPSEVVFTSGGTEADALAILGALEAAGERRHIVSTAVEHSAVRDLLRRLRDAGHITLTEVGVARDGTLDANAVLAAIREDTALVTVMWANNETGILHPVEAVAAGCRARGVPFHSDAVQAAGKVAVDLRRVPADLISISAHKIHGPKGVGALVVRRGARWKPPPAAAGHQEGGRRAGTENTPGIAGFGAAAAAALRALPEEGRIRAFRNRLEDAVLAAVPGSRRAAAAEPRTPNTSLLLFPGTEGEMLVLRLDARGIAASTGSACAEGKVEASPVLRAMGIPGREARGAVRLSLSRFTTEEEVDRAARAIAGEARPPRTPPAGAPPRRGTPGGAPRGG